MAWDASKPVSGGYLNSAEIRANFEAIERSLWGKNLVMDPNHLIWPSETADGAASQTDPPAHFDLSGTGATMQRCGSALTDTTDYNVGGFAAELTYGSATALLEQTLFSSLPTYFRSLPFTLAAAVKCSSSNAARLRIDDGVTPVYSNYHSGGGSWEWLTLEAALASNATELTVGFEVGSSTAHIQAWTCLFGLIPNIYFIPAETIHGMIYWPKNGTIATGTGFAVWAPSRPGIVKHVQLRAETAPTGAALIVDVNTWDGAAMTSMFSTRPQIDAADYQGDGTPDDDYARRCYDANKGDTVPDGGLMNFDVDQVGSTVAGSDLIVEVKCMQFVDPLESWRTD